MRLVAMDIFPGGEKIVQREADGDDHAAARTVTIDRQQDLERMDELRKMLQQPGTFAERLPYQTDMEMFQVPQSTMN